MKRITSKIKKLTKSYELHIDTETYDVKNPGKTLEPTVDVVAKSKKKSKTTKVGKDLIKGLKEAVKHEQGKVSLRTITRTGPQIFTVKRAVVSGTSYPYSVKKEVIVQGKNYTKVLDEFSKYLSKNKSSDTYCYELSDNEYSLYEYYDQNGKLKHRSSQVERSLPFSGNDNPNFKESQIVEVLEWDELKLGVVIRQTMSTAEAKKRNLKLDYSDNNYLVDFSMDTSDHSHPYDKDMRLPSFPVPPEKAEELKRVYEELSKEFKD